MRKTKVHWTTAELLQINAFVEAHPYWVTSRAILQAQNMLLPPERHMARTSVYESLKRGNYYKYVAAAKLKEPPVAAKFAIEFIGDEPEDEPPPPIQLDEHSMNVLAEKVTALIMPSLVDAMRDLVISQRISKMVPTDEDIRNILEQDPAMPGRISARRRIDVLGLLPSQAEVVKTFVGPRDDLKLRFILSEHASRVDRYAPDVIMCTGFVSHSHQDRIRSSGARLHYANGAAASVTNILSGLIHQ